jgi:hypothetical protein
MDWEKLTNDVVAAASTAFASLMSEKAGEHFYVFALYTDGDAWTILPSANSIEQHEAKVRDTGETDVQQIAYYKWASAEWAYEAWKKQLFTGIYQELENHRTTLPKTQVAYEAYKNSVHECMIAALKKMDEKGFFARERENILIYISSSDGDEGYVLENQSVKRLNPEQLYVPFLKRYG